MNKEIGTLVTSWNLGLNLSRSLWSVSVGLRSVNLVICEVESVCLRNSSRWSTHDVQGKLTMNSCVIPH